MFWWRLFFFLLLLSLVAFFPFFVLCSLSLLARALSLSAHIFSCYLTLLCTLCSSTLTMTYNPIHRRTQRHTHRCGVLPSHFMTSIIDESRKKIPHKHTYSRRWRLAEIVLVSVSYAAWMYACAMSSSNNVHIRFRNCISVSRWKSC